MHAGDRAGGRELDEQVAVRHGVHGVLRDLRTPLGVDEAELLRGELAVNRQRRPGDGAGAERAPVGMRGDFAEPADVAVEHFEPGKNMVREEHRLGALEMRVTGDEHVAVGRRDREQRPLGAAQPRGEVGAGVLEPQPHVGRDLVVAAPGRVQLGRRRHALGQRLLDVHVHVLELHVPGELAGRDLGEDGVEPGVDGGAFLRGDQPDVREHGRVRLAPGDVERREAMVKRHGLAEFQHEFGGTRGEASAPGGLRGGFGHSVRDITLPRHPPAMRFCPPQGSPAFPEAFSAKRSALSALPRPRQSLLPVQHQLLLHVRAEALVHRAALGRAFEHAVGVFGRRHRQPDRHS